MFPVPAPLFQTFYSLTFHFSFIFPYSCFSLLLIFPFFSSCPYYISHIWLRQLRLFPWLICDEIVTFRDDKPVPSSGLPRPGWPSAHTNNQVCWLVMISGYDWLFIIGGLWFLCNNCWLIMDSYDSRVMFDFLCLVGYDRFVMIDGLYSVLVLSWVLRWLCLACLAMVGWWWIVIFDWVLWLVAFYCARRDDAYIRGWIQMVYCHFIYSPETKQTRQWDISILCYGTSVIFTYKMVTIHSNMELCAWWVLFVMPDSSSHPPCCSMRLLPPPLLVINCLSCSPPGGLGPPPFPPPGLTPFPSGSRHLPASPSATIMINEEYYTEPAYLLLATSVYYNRYNSKQVMIAVYM